MPGRLNCDISFVAHSACGPATQIDVPILNHWDVGFACRSVHATPATKRLIETTRALRDQSGHMLLHMIDKNMVFQFEQ